MNRIKLESIAVSGNTIEYLYTIVGEWKKYFHLDKTMKIKYEIEIASVPESILAIPFICNILPIVWLCDAELIVNEIDKDFYDNMPLIKKGYEQMYPMLKFAGSVVIAEKIELNQVQNQDKCAAFFSGGVDAYTTLFRHLSDNPCLITLWGADISLSDEKGWNKVIEHTKKVAGYFNLDYTVVKTNFREVIDERSLNKLVKDSRDEWWHGFQCGIGMISHSAPIAYIKELRTVYIASSFPEKMKGKYTCASDPIIDNHVKYCGCTTVHDGYEMDRQGKIHFLVRKRAEGFPIVLRVCWKEPGGGNCCRCEKCYRTILEIVAEGDDPNQYGFVWDDEAIRACKKDMKYKIVIASTKIEQFYIPLPEIMKSNREKIHDYEKYKWLMEMNFSKFNNMPVKVVRSSLPVKVVKKVCRIVYRGIVRK